MNLIDFSSSSLSLLPPLIAITLAIVMRRVLLSLGIGILVSAILLTNYSFICSVDYVIQTVSNVFFIQEKINSENIYILSFLLLLGVMTAILTLSGGTFAFANWAKGKVKNKRGSKLLAAFLGIIVFIDDYFNSLAVGAIARPITDRFYVSRVKLAYILDSTAASTCVLVPISSWGAYIMTILSSILISHSLTTEYSPLSLYLHLIPMNFYSIFAILMVFAVIVFKLDVGPMRYHEIKIEQKKFTNPAFKNNSKEGNSFPKIKGKVSDLLIPIFALLVMTISMMLYTGYHSITKNGKPFTFFSIFENTDFSLSLFCGGLAGVILSLLITFQKRIQLIRIMKTVWIGAQSMFGAILILLFSWVIGSSISDMKTGIYLSSLISKTDMPIYLLPVIFFFISGLMAFATGTSWGTFGIMLPLAGDIATTINIGLFLPILSSVLSGSVFGDHCSPISDTTILSATGAKCNYIDHVVTQLPYALSIAITATAGFLTLAKTSSIAISFSVATIVFVATCLILSILSKSKIKNM
ncbi:hypothetical protein CF66_2287 [Candidatus Photodesmus katoptron]|uniref:Na+/H+ antiporter, NhaD n=1 Tax=Candidatus Photodesmus katoptron Akat1 TaxID=1236703 RepID=S3EHM1_9GAMM|nr:Na+/H+ antiporter NhaC family protein [Candidatus Photodesmus katoptron]EPE37683.1 na+/H+ antiporter, NhaD [Candidatus Photodesmus katoptron Akat1]KEY90596.1 hypothetical protein CF66_2287 [Candidatus Photodesmus katoptron]